MQRTADGRWVIVEGTDSAYGEVSVYDLPSVCQRCGVRVYGEQGRELHDGFHDRVGQ